jgi:hypothetical protein
MHSEYASALARGVVAPDEDPTGRAGVVVGTAPALGTVGDLDSAPQAATATPNTTAAAGHSLDERITPPRRQTGLPPSSPRRDTPPPVSATYQVFDMPTIWSGS